MRTIKQLSAPQNVNDNLPFGGILNETSAVQGTPVVEEIYGDVLSNIYKILEQTGVVANGTQDNDDTQYQLIEALKKLPNSLNDIQQTLSLTSNQWFVPFNLERLPNKYFFIAKPNSDYISGIPYIFKGNGLVEYTFASDGFKANEPVLVIIDQSQVKAFSLISTKNETISAVGGFPISYNDTNKMYYFENGVMYDDTPMKYSLQSIIRVNLSDGTIIVKDVVVLGGFVLCLCYGTSYFFRKFALTDLTTVLPVTINGASFSDTIDNDPYIFASSGFIYISNDMNATVNDFDLHKFAFTGGNLTLVATETINSTFKKTTNYFIKNNDLFTIETSDLVKYDLNTNTKTNLGKQNTKIGQLLAFNSNPYFVVGEIGTKWLI